MKKHIRIIGSLLFSIFVLSANNRIGDKPVTDRRGDSEMLGSFDNKKIVVLADTIRPRTTSSPLFVDSFSVALIPQRPAISCWAASAAMIYAFVRSIKIDNTPVATLEEEILNGIGAWGNFPKKLLENGLPPESVSLLGEINLCCTARLYNDVEGFHNLLKAKGPLWCTTAVPGAHVVVVYGIMGDGTPENTMLLIHDPWGKNLSANLTNEQLAKNKGQSYQKSFKKFMAEMEGSGATTSKTQASIFVAYPCNDKPTPGSQSGSNMNARSKEVHCQDKANVEAILGFKNASIIEITDQIADNDDIQIKQNTNSKKIIYYIDIEHEGRGDGNRTHANNIQTMLNEKHKNEYKVIYVHYLKDKAVYRANTSQVLAYFISGNSAEWTEYKAVESKISVTLNDLDTTLQEFIKYLKARPNLPIFAVCGGHQLIAMGYGSTVERMLNGNGDTVTGEEGGNTLPTEIFEDDPIFNGIQKEDNKFAYFRYYHHDRVKDKSPSFSRLARTSLCEIQCLKWNGTDRLIYTTQFHPEQDDDAFENGNKDNEYKRFHGKQMIYNFIGLCKKWHGIP